MENQGISIYFARHGSVEKQFLGRYIGSTEAMLSEKGVRQAKDLADKVADLPIEAIYCSPLQRTRQTANPLAARLNLDLDFVDDLREIDFGAWEGLNYVQIQQQSGELLQAWLQQPDIFEFPGGESMPDFWRRLESLVKRIKTLEHKSILLISHGGVLRALCCLLLGLPRKHIWTFTMEYAGLGYIQSFGETGVLHYLNR